MPAIVSQIPPAANVIAKGLRDYLYTFIYLLQMAITAGICGEGTESAEEDCWPIISYRLVLSQ